VWPSHCLCIEALFTSQYLSASLGGPCGALAGTRAQLWLPFMQMSGFVLVKKVPGTMHFHMKSSGFSFNSEEIDVSHMVHAFTFGTRPSPRRLFTLGRLHPGGLGKDWADKLKGQTFMSQLPQYTHEHFMQLIRTTLEPATGGPYASYDAYEYTVHSHSYISEISDITIPAAKFSFQPSPMQVCRLLTQSMHVLACNSSSVTRGKQAEKCGKRAGGTI
jgi:hypothetical protein